MYFSGGGMASKGGESGGLGDAASQSELAWDLAIRAMKKGDAQQLRLIVEANPSLKTEKTMAGGFGERGIFHIATMDDEVSCSKYLAEAGCDIHEAWTVELGERSYTPLSLAILCRTASMREQMFRALMKASTPEVGASGAGWKIAMGAAAAMGDIGIMRDIWMRLGPDAKGLWTENIDDVGGLLHHAAAGGSLEALDFAWCWDGVPETCWNKNSHGLAPKDIAKRNKHPEMARELDRRATALEEAAALSAAASHAEAGSRTGRRI